MTAVSPPSTTVEKAPGAAPAPLDRVGTVRVRAAARRVLGSYALRAILQSVLTVFAVMTFTFFLIRQMPGNPVDIKIEELMIRQSLTFDEARRAAASLFSFDLDRPAHLQYVDYITGLLRGDMGVSITQSGVPVSSIILRYLPWTLFSVGTALLISFTTGVLVGLAMGYWRGSWFDNVLTTFASIVSGIPDYIIALLIILVFGVQLQWFSVGGVRGGVDPTIPVGFTVRYIGSVLQYAAMPILIYVLASVGTWVLAMKSSTLSTLGEDYITVAQARGLSQQRVLTSYVGRNAMLPLVTQLAIGVGFVVGGSVIIEEMFQYPGLGRNLFIAISRRDYTTMQGIFLVITTAVVLANLLADLVVGWLDPRVRVQKG